MTDALELGCGYKPLEMEGYDFTHHDRWGHSDFVDIAWDLEKLPWPWKDEQFQEVWATDVMEHLHLEVQEWLDECWRILRPDGLLRLRLAAWDNPLSYRDPTHQRVFHPQTFDYWDPDKGLWAEFGKFYFTERWWRVGPATREEDDLRYLLVKRGS